MQKQLEGLCSQVGFFLKFIEHTIILGITSDPERIQLQRIVRRCSCEIYFCYFSEIMKTDTLEETVVQKVEPEAVFGRQEGVDCLTLKHNMLEASTSSEQYEMLVDIVNALVLFVDPKKKEQAENRRRIQFSCELTEMENMRKSIEQQQVFLTVFYHCKLF